MDHEEEKNERRVQVRDKDDYLLWLENQGWLTFIGSNSYPILIYSSLFKEKVTGGGTYQW